MLGMITCCTALMLHTPFGFEHTETGQLGQLGCQVRSLTGNERMMMQIQPQSKLMLDLQPKCQVLYEPTYGSQGPL